jgi:hypothetical protein
MLRGEWSGSRTPVGGKRFSLLHNVETDSGTNPASNKCVLEFFFGGKGPEREFNHSSPSSAEVKNDWSYTYTPLYVFTAWAENFTFFIW